MHPEENGDRDVRVVKEVRPGRLEIQEAHRVHRDDGGHSHRRHAEEELPRQGGQENRQVDVRRIELRVGDEVAQRDVRAAGDDQGQREHREREGGRIEDVRGTSLPVPPDELLGEEPHCDHRELQKEPLRPEPEEQVDAEDNWKWPESECVRVAARPGHEAVDGVRKNQLGQDEGEERIDNAGVPSPIEKHRPLCARLQPVLRARHELERELPARATRRDSERRAPCQHRDSRANERAQQGRLLSYGEEREDAERRDERTGERERLPRWKRRRDRAGGLRYQHSSIWQIRARRASSIAVGAVPLVNAP